MPPRRRITLKNRIVTRKAAVLFLLAVTVCLRAYAWPFGAKDKPRERVVAKLDKARGADFRHAVDLRQMRSEEIRVLTRLVAEKNSELSGFDAELKSMCAMSDDAAYSYNPTNRTLYLVSTNAMHGATGASPALLPHHAFANEEEADEFLRPLGAKQITLRQLETFHQVIREKQSEYSLADKYLAAKYGIKSDRKYRFDEKTGELFETLPQSSPSSQSSSTKERTKQ